MKNIKHIFVYGSLKTDGFLFHTYLSPFSKEIIKAHIDNSTLYDINAGYPAVLLKGKGKVFGELHRIQEIEDALSVLDAVEGYSGAPTKMNLYNRKIVPVVIRGNKKIYAYVYEYNRSLNNATPIKSGVWENKNR